MLGERHKRRVSWLGMFMRGWRPDRNPLRRRSDRAESAVLALLFVVFLAAVPFVSQACYSSEHSMADRVQQAQRTWRQVPAVLLKPESREPVSTSLGVYFPEALARWTAPDGMVVTGDVPVGLHAAAGTTLRVWVTRGGQLTAPPVHDSQVPVEAGFAAALGAVALAVALTLVGALVRRVLDSRRMAGWEAAWLATGPRWTGPA